MAGTSRLSEVARHVIQPADIVDSLWWDVEATCTGLGLTFDRWQDGLGSLILATREDGTYAADTSVVSIPRQVGKTYLLGCIAFALCLRQPNTTVIWTAHRFKTARETFTSMKAMARKTSVAPEIARIANANGEEGIYFENGSRVLFGARENGFGLGFAGVGVLVLDEAQRLSSKAMDDLIPTTNAHPNPLILLTGTPPRPTDPGEVFTMLRQEALAGESEGTLYVEISADRGADLDDREQWQRANPSYPHRTPERSILRMRKNLSEASFRREALGVWDELTKQFSPINGALWSDRADVGPVDGTKPDGLAVDMSHSRHISVGACWLEAESAHVEEVWAGIDESAAVDWVAARAGRRTLVLIDSMSPAASMVPALKARGVKVHAGTSSDMSKACGLVASEIEGGTLTHADQESVNAAREGARRRAIGSAGGWGYDRSNPSVNIAPLVAVSLARLGASMKKKPNNKAGGRRVVTG